jgi:hypothetical protein
MEENVPQELIISTDWTEDQIIYFLTSLIKDSIFGYSAAFKYEDIIRRAQLYDISVRPLPAKHPLRIKYGNYVLKITKPYKKNKIPSKAIYEVKFNCKYIRKKAKKNIKCNIHPELCLLTYGMEKAYPFHTCTNTIYQNTEYIEVIVYAIDNIRKFKRISLCPECSAKLIEVKIAELKELKISLPIS